jgi:hypothetical protein
MMDDNPTLLFKNLLISFALILSICSLTINLGSLSAYAAEFSVAPDLKDAIAQYVVAQSDAGTGNYQSYPSGNNDWEFVIVPYLWMSGLSGDIGVRGQTADVDVSFSDIFDALDFGGQVHIGVRKRNLGFFVDTTYLKLSVDRDVQVFDAGPGADVDLEVKEFLLELGGFYRFGTWPIGSPHSNFVQRENPSFTLDALAGGRYTNLDVEIDIDSDLPFIPSEADGDQDWLDLFVGARLIFNPTENLVFVLRSDIGGFGFGFSSDISWNLVGWVGYELPWWGMTPIIGYRALYTDYDDGSGDDRFVYDMWAYGPLVGLAFRF